MLEVGGEDKGEMCRDLVEFLRKNPAHIENFGRGIGRRGVNRTL